MRKAPALPDCRAVIADLADLAFVPVIGNSMEPVILDGDRALINLDDRDVGRPGIFALLDDRGTLQLLQVELVRGGSNGRRILCSYANPRYRPFELDLIDPVKIVVRVVHKVTRHL
jgi:phage repressor protein C with HTH and peptisase S24 domain